MTSNSASGWFDQESSTSLQEGWYEDSSDSTDSGLPDTSISQRPTRSGAFYGTEMTRKLWNRLSTEARLDTSMETTADEVRISYSDALNFLGGTN